MTEEANQEAIPVKRRRRRSAVDGIALKLDAPSRPGYVRRWVLDNPARLKKMQDELGYDFVHEEAGEGSKRTHGQGTRITRFGGSDKEGRPQQHVLMETPIEEYQAGRAEIEAQLKQTDDAILAGRDTRGQLEDAYRTSDRSSISHPKIHNACPSQAGSG